MWEWVHSTDVVGIIQGCVDRREWGGGGGRGVLEYIGMSFVCPGSGVWSNSTFVFLGLGEEGGGGAGRGIMLKI